MTSIRRTASSMSLDWTTSERRRRANAELSRITANKLRGEVNTEF